MKDLADYTARKNSVSKSFKVIHLSKL